MTDLIARFLTSRAADVTAWGGVEAKRRAPTIAVVGPETIFRQGIIAMIEDRHPDWVVRVVGGVDEATRLFAGPDRLVVLMDPDRWDELAPTGWARHLFIGLTEPANAGEAMRYIDRGYRAIVPHDTSAALFWCAIETVLAGGFFLPSKPVVSDDVSTSGLSPRQRQVLDLLLGGCDTKTIARALDLSPGTIKIHLAAIYRALGVSTRLEAVAVMRQRGQTG